jgi:hypothetical protein
MTGAINSHIVNQRVKGLQLKYNLTIHVELLAHRVDLPD